MFFFLIFIAKIEWQDDKHVASRKVKEGMSIVQTVEWQDQQEDLHFQLWSALIPLAFEHLIHQTIPSVAQESAPTPSAHSTLSSLLSLKFFGFQIFLVPFQV